MSCHDLRLCSPLILLMCRLILNLRVVAGVVIIVRKLPLSPKPIYSSFPPAFSMFLGCTAEMMGASFLENAASFALGHEIF